MTKADWLRSEIEKLETLTKERPDKTDPDMYEACYAVAGFNGAIDSIITRYKEELKVLESNI